MAIKNASDLLVYAKTTAPAKQVTRIRVLISNPFEAPDGGTQGDVKIDNMTNGSGQVFDDVTTSTSSNAGSSLLFRIKQALEAKNYVDLSSSDQPAGDYVYRDFENFANGIVPTLSIKDGTATLNEGAIIIEIVTPGSSAIFDPVAFSTSASFSTNMDLRDVTNKDSGGYSQSLGGLRSFEISTDLLQSINPDVPLDGTDFFDKLKARSLVDLSFSDRIRNIIRTNLTQSGVDGFTLDGSPISQTNLQDDPFGGSTASKLSIASSTTYKGLKYNIDSSRLEGKYVTFTFYVKGDPASPNNAEATFWVNNGSDVSLSSFEILSGDGTIATLTSASVKKITGLNTGANNVSANWTRVRATYNFQSGATNATTYFALTPGLANAQVADDIIYVSSWQIEFKDGATNYQDPTDITHWQGNALVSSVSFDAGVEDNLTCSATFTGTGQIFPNGLGPELISDTGFNDASYWDVNDSAAGASSIIQDGYGKIITSGDYTDISKDGILTAGDVYLLTYSVHTNSQGGIALGDIESNVDVNLAATPGQTHNVEFKANIADLVIKRIGATTIWLSSISLKKVL